MSGKGKHSFGYEKTHRGKNFLVGGGRDYDRGDDRVHDRSRFLRNMSRALAVIVVLVVLVAAVSTLGTSGIKEYRRTDAIDREIAEMDRQAQQLRRDVSALRERVKFLTESDNYRERAVKEMGYRRKDEFAVEIPVFEERVKVEETAEKSSVSIERESSPRKWWRAFFGSDN